MADPICRWRNPSLKTVCELVNSMPHTEMTKNDFREFMSSSKFGDGFFHTPYQLACQLGLYYESEDSKFIPRFKRDIDDEDAKLYLEHWIHRYYVPNPYTKQGFKRLTNPIYLVKSIVKYIEDNPKSTNITDICNYIFKEETGNKDILKNVLNNFSKTIRIDINDNTTLLPNYKTIINNHMDRNDKKLFFDTIGNEISKNLADEINDLDKYNTYFAAIRTKPFILLAGISGTGKSRLVREFAYRSCLNLGTLQEDLTTPGNFCMIEVKPNWHDSSELLGYSSGIKNKYIVTPFIKFLVKAMRFPEVPFFICLDEMNLAPVEQYFAEYLSVLETRRLEKESIISGSLINKDVFKIYEDDIFNNLGLETSERNDVEEVVQLADIENELKEFGLRLPQNVIVVGTVNMDDTTHQFSRKVIDRAMTIEMNNLNFDNMFLNNTKMNYTDNPLNNALFISDCVSATQAIELIDSEQKDNLASESVSVMKKLDEILKDTPFRVAYRVHNELVLYFRNLSFIKNEEKFENLFPKAVDAILNMKVLPRIEGDEDLVEKPLKDLESWCKEKGYQSSLAKINEMLARLNRTHYTSYWP